MGLIDTYKLINDIEHLKNSINEEYKKTGRKELIEIINILNIVDSIIVHEPTVKRPKGEWEFTKTIFDKYGCTVKCPSCHKKWKTYDEIRWKKENKFCPSCGAEMRGVE